MATQLDPAVEVHRLTLEQYERMIEAGVFAEDDHVELLEGVLVEMSPQDNAHERAIVWLTEQFVVALAGRALVRPQLSLRLVQSVSRPEPDLSVVGLDAPVDQSPPTALLAIEVANTSHRIDRGLKARLYAQAGVSEYWIVDIPGRAIEVRTEPVEDAYSQLEVVSAGAMLTPSLLGAPAIDVAALFAFAEG